MSRVAMSPWYLGWVAFCSALCVAMATGATRGDGLAVQIAAGLFGLVVALAIAYLSLVLLARSSAEPQAAAPPDPVAAATESEDTELRARLEVLLATGRSLRGEPPNERVAEWIETTRGVLEVEAPGAARYFAASEWPAHVRRLETVLRDFL